ncbi:MAG: hypothetical protein ACE5O2_17775, partial [Armatimonadota bacterium]
GFSSVSPSSRQAQRTLWANLLAQGPTYQLVLTGVRDLGRTRLFTSAGGTQVSTTRTSSVSVNGLLRHPAYPTVSLQYERSLSQPGGGQSAGATTFLVGANYDWGPLRLIANETGQQIAHSDTSSRSSAYGVIFEEALLHDLRMSVEHFSSRNRIESPGSRRATTDRTTTIRCFALPTPFLTMDASVSLLNVSTEDAHGARAWRGQEYAANLRSEVFPGVVFDASHRAQMQSTDFGKASSDQSHANLSLRLTPVTYMSADWSASSATTSDTTEVTSQHSARFFLTHELNPYVEILLEYGDTLQRFRDSRYENTSASAGLRGSLDPSTYVGLGLRYDRRLALLENRTFDDTTVAVELEASWRPDARYGVTAGLSLLRTTGTATSRAVAPFVELRIAPDPATTISVRYNRQDVRQSEPDFPEPIVSQTATSTIRLTRLLSNGATADISYDLIQGAAGPVVRQRTVQVRYTARF